MKMAGIDVHKKVLMVVVIETTSPEEKPERRRFTTLPGDLSRLSSWLRAQDVQEAVMLYRPGLQLGSQGYGVRGSFYWCGGVLSLHSPRDLALRNAQRDGE